MVADCRSWRCCSQSFCLGGAWHDLHWNYVEADDLARYAADVAEPVCLEAVADQAFAVESRTTGKSAASNSCRATQRSRNRNHPLAQWHASGRRASGNVRLRVNGVLPEITPGDRLLVFARLAKSITGDESRPIRLRPAAERTAGRHCELFTQSPACVSVIEPASGCRPDSWLAAAGRWCQTAARSICRIRNNRQSRRRYCLASVANSMTKRWTPS